MSVEAIKKALEGVTQEEAIDFINTAMRNWNRLPKLDADDLRDLAEELQRFSERRYASTLESLQRENKALKIDASNHAADAETVRRERETERRRAEAAEAEVKRMSDRYERWMPVTDAPPAGTHPDALLHFYCIRDEVDGEESPEYWMTDTWQDKPADAVFWCAIVSPCGPHETTFIARTALASTGCEHHAE